MRRTARAIRRVPNQACPQQIQSLLRRLALVRELECVLKDHTAALNSNRPAIHFLRTIPSGAALPQSKNDPASCHFEVAPVPTAVVSRGLGRQGGGGSRGA